MGSGWSLAIGERISGMQRHHRRAGRRPVSSRGVSKRHGDPELEPMGMVCRPMPRGRLTFALGSMGATGQ